MIEMNNVSFTYPSKKGIFDINFSVEEGTVTGYLGPNGAGKTSTIRILLGFMKAQKGQSKIGGLDCFNKSNIIKNTVGYIPGEIAFSSHLKAREYLIYQADLRKMKDYSKMNELIDRFELDVSGKIKKLSKGTKQKLAIVSAFMHSPDTLILDEPTSGLDPLMQNEFISLIQEEKKKGTTILLSSHSFEEVQKTCDDVIIIKDGRIIKQQDIHSLSSSQRKAYIIKTDDEQALKSLGYEIGKTTSFGTEIFIQADKTDAFLKDLSKLKITSIDSKTQNLEDIFLNYYTKRS